MFNISLLFRMFNEMYGCIGIWINVDIPHCVCFFKLNCIVPPLPACWDWCTGHAWVWLHSCLLCPESLPLTITALVQSHVWLATCSQRLRGRTGAIGSVVGERQLAFVTVWMKWLPKGETYGTERLLWLQTTGFNVSVHPSLLSRGTVM